MRKDQTTPPQYLQPRPVLGILSPLLRTSRLHPLSPLRRPVPGRVGQTPSLVLSVWLRRNCLAHRVPRLHHTTVTLVLLRPLAGTQYRSGGHKSMEMMLAGLGTG